MYVSLFCSLICINCKGPLRAQPCSDEIQTHRNLKKINNKSQDVCNHFISIDRCVMLWVLFLFIGEKKVPFINVREVRIQIKLFIQICEGVECE